jgi:hypothetical protein
MRRALRFERFRAGARGAAVAGVGAALLSLAASGAELAPPGECAQPDKPLAGEPRRPFDVAGPPALHFTPTDVAAGGGAASERPQPPGPQETPRLACDAPDAGCSSALLESAPAVGLVESPAVPDLPPGAGEGDRR